MGIALDSSGKIYVADAGNPYASPPIPPNVFVYSVLGSRTGLLNEAPIATISGSNTGLVYPDGIAVDSSRNIYVADYFAVKVLVYPALGSSTGLLDEAPTATISGSNTGLLGPVGIALDSSGNIYVADYGALSVFVYLPLGSSTGPLNEVPSAIISGSDTGLISPAGIAVDSSRNIYVDDSYACSVFVYPAGSSGDVVPSSATISTTVTTGLSSPQGIAVDSSGKIYAADCPACYGERGAPSVFVYPAGSNGNLAPTDTITGSKTGLEYPAGIALDSSGNIYVADEDAASVFVYSAGSTGNVAPTATISGPDTGLASPEGIALIPAATSMWRTTGPPACLSIRRWKAAPGR